MANCLRMPMASSLCCSSSSSSASVVQSTKRRSFSVINSAKIPMPPINPKDPFLSRLASLAATSPDTLLNRPKNSDLPPFLDVFDSPTLMATPAQVERSVSYNEHRPRRPPPDLPSLLLHGRIVYIGMPVTCLTLFFVHLVCSNPDFECYKKILSGVRSYYGGIEKECRNDMVDSVQNSYAPNNLMLTSYPTAFSFINMLLT